MVYPLYTPFALMGVAWRQGAVDEEFSAHVEEGSFSIFFVGLYAARNPVAVQLHSLERSHMFVQRAVL